MKVKSALLNISCRALYESMGIDMMVRVAESVLPGYDIHARSGIPANIPITAVAAAEQILRDISAEDAFLIFGERLIQISEQGFMGREYRIPLLPQIVKAIAADGYAYDRRTGLFMENTRERVTPTWGRIVEGEERQIAFLKLDIVENSKLVRDNPKQKVDEAYVALRNLVSRSVTMRFGRVWSWEGDGCVCAFLFGEKERAAILAGMEILHELFFFNRLSNPLGTPIRLRIAAHAGPGSYQAECSRLHKEETIREVSLMESTYAKPDTLCASINVYLPVDRVIQERFGPEKTVDGYKLKTYALVLEQV
jgi:class 3 adenylate cyclase